MFEVKSIATQRRGKLYTFRIDQQQMQLLVTFHCLQRLEKWKISEKQLFETLFDPEEVVHGHGSRYFAHKRYMDHVFRIVYEYEKKIPIIITAYLPYAKQYFQGGGTYEDKIF